MTKRPSGSVHLKPAQKQCKYGGNSAGPLKTNLVLAYCYFREFRIDHGIKQEPSILDRFYSPRPQYEYPRRLCCTRLFPSRAHPQVSGSPPPVRAIVAAPHPGSALLAVVDLGFSHRIQVLGHLNSQHSDHDVQSLILTACAVALSLGRIMPFPPPPVWCHDTNNHNLFSSRVTYR